MIQITDDDNEDVIPEMLSEEGILDQGRQSLTIKNYKDIDL